MFDGGSKGILGEVYSSNIGVVGQGIDDRLNSRSGGCCLSSRRHEEDCLDGLFKLLRSEGMVGGERRTTMPGTNRWESPELNADGACLTCGRLCGQAHASVRSQFTFTYYYCKRHAYITPLFSPAARHPRN
jgi:hypothetical protein